VPDRKNFFSTSKKEGYSHKKFAFSPFEQYIYITCIKNFPINEVISKVIQKMAKMSFAKSCKG
jgi:hypothetical protein